MRPPVPQGLLREFPASKGGMVGPYYVPPGTQVHCPTWSLHHDERYFEKPDSWIPERWTSKPGLIKDKRAFVPFGLGPMGCAGKHFAMQEMKVFLAKVIIAFDISFEDGDNGSKLLMDNKDCFTIALPSQTMMFQPR